MLYKNSMIWVHKILGGGGGVGLPYKKDGSACRTFQWLKSGFGTSQGV